MLFNEKYGIAHISYSTGRILIEHSPDEELPGAEENFDGLLRGFSKLIGGERESLGMSQYRIAGAPFEFIFQLDSLDGIVISVENMRRIDEIVDYVKNSLANINYNMLYQQTDFY